MYGFTLFAAGVWGVLLFLYSIAAIVDVNGSLRVRVLVLLLAFLGLVLIAGALQNIGLLRP